MGKDKWITTSEYFLQQEKESAAYNMKRQQV